MATVALDNGTINVSRTKELWVITPNEVGTVAKVTSSLAEAKLNIKAMWAGAVGDQGNFSILTDDNRKAINLLKQAGLPKVVEREIVMVEVPNESGVCWELAQRISEAGIDINYWYVTVDGPNAIMIMSTKDDDEVLKILQ